MSKKENLSGTGKVWEEFCESLKASGHIILNQKDLTNLDVHEGWRYLTRLTRLGFEMALENNDAFFPSFYSVFCSLFLFCVVLLFVVFLLRFYFILYLHFVLL